MADFDVKNVGHGKAYPTPNDAKDASCGVYKDNTEAMSADDKLPVKQMPKAPDPSPFILGPMAKGGR